MNRLLTGSLVALLALPAATADAQVYPDRIVIKDKARVVTSAAAYQRRTRDDNREEQVDRTTKTFKLGANGSLSLSNIAGDITVTRGTGSDTTVEIVKTARARDAAEARELLQLVTVEAVERPGRAEVKTYYPSEESRRKNRRNMDVSVAYVVTAPASARIGVESISGNIKIADIKGDLTANTISGDVTLTRVTANRIDAGSVSGRVRLEDIQCERVEASTMSSDIWFSGQLMKNGRYRLKGFSGDVRVVLGSSTGFELDASSFSGDIRAADFAMTSRRAGSHSLSGTYGDGSAVLDLSTFSGSITISKR